MLSFVPIILTAIAGVNEKAMGKYTVLSAADLPYCT